MHAKSGRIIFYVKKILTHSVFYGMSNFFVSVTTFLLIPLYTRCLTPEEYGVYAIVTVFGTMVFYFCDMGLLHALMRYYFDFEVKTPKERSRITSTVLWFFCGVTILVSIPLLAASGKISYLLLGTEKYRYLVELIVGIVFFSVASGVPITILRIKEKSALYMSFFLFKGIGTIVLAYILLDIFKRGLNGTVESMFLVAFLTSILAFLITFKNYNFTFSLKYLRQMLKFGLPLCPVILFSWVIDFFDRYLVRYFLSLADAGIYSLGYKFGQVMYMVVMAFIMCWHPILFNIIKEENAQKIIAKLATYAIVVFIFASLVVASFSREIVMLIAGNSYHSAYKIVPFISFSYCMYGVYIIFMSGVLISKQVFKQPIILGTAAVINILLNVALIPYLGLLGAAIATVLTFLFTAIYTYLESQRSYFVPYELKRIVLASVSAVIIFSFTMLVSSENLIYSIGIKSLIICLFPVSLFMLGILNKAQLQKVKEILTRESAVASEAV